MTTIPLIGTYERKLDVKNRLFMPSGWSDAIAQYREFFFYQPAAVKFISIISKEHFERNKYAMFENLASPLLCNENNQEDYIKEMSCRYGPILANINLETKNLRLTIPQAAPFLKEINEDRKITLIGCLDYFTLFHGTIDSVIQRS